MSPGEWAVTPAIEYINYANKVISPGKWAVSPVIEIC